MGTVGREKKNYGAKKRNVKFFKRIFCLPFSSELRDDWCVFPLRFNLKGPKFLGIRKEAHPDTPKEYILHRRNLLQWPLWPLKSCDVSICQLFPTVNWQNQDNFWVNPNYLNWNKFKTYWKKVTVACVGILTLTTVVVPVFPSPIKTRRKNFQAQKSWPRWNTWRQREKSRFTSVLRKLFWVKDRFELEVCKFNLASELSRGKSEIWGDKRKLWP